MAEIDALILVLPPPSALPYTVAAIEIAFGFWLTWISLSKDFKETAVALTNSNDQP